jgi:lysyl-tRNA synthetase class 2
VIPGQRLARLRARAAIYDAIRAHLKAQGFLEVQVCPLAAEAIPEDHIDLFSLDGAFLMASPELAMKQLLAEGTGAIFTLGPAFRRGEVGRLHRPCFEMLEWYRLGGGLGDLAADVEALVGAALAAARAVAPDLVPPAPLWTRFDLCALVQDLASWDPATAYQQDRFDLTMADQIEPRLATLDGVLLGGWPAAQASLAALDPQDPRRALRLEAYWRGTELANGFVELADPAQQRRRFQRTNAVRQAHGLPALPLPEGFLAALATLPPCAGMALGLDRLVMLATGAADIAQVLAYDGLQSAPRS